MLWHALRVRMSVTPAEDDTPRLVCNACGYNWCRSCKVAWHKGKSCDEHIRAVRATCSKSKVHLIRVVN